MKMNHLYLSFIGLQIWGQYRLLWCLICDNDGGDVRGVSPSLLQTGHHQHIRGEDGLGFNQRMPGKNILKKC